MTHINELNDNETQPTALKNENEEEFVDETDVLEEVPVDTHETHMEEADDMEANEVEENDEVRNEGENVQFEDDSVQGFFDHHEPVYSLDIHPTQQNVICSGGGDDKAYLWRLDNGEKIFELTAHSDSVVSVAFSVDGQYVATGGMDGKVNISTSVSGKFIGTLDGPDEVTIVKWHPKGNVLVAGSADGSIWMWSIPNGTMMHVFIGHGGPVTNVQFTPDGKTLVSSSEDATIISWDPKTGSLIHKFTTSIGRFHTQPITTFAIHSDSQLLVTGGVDSVAVQCQLGTGKIIGPLQAHTESVESVDFCDVMPLVATGSVDGLINIWDFQTLRIRHTFRHSEAITQIKFIKNTTKLISTSADKTASLWDARSGEILKTWKGHQDAVLCFTNTSDGQYVITGSDDG